MQAHQALLLVSFGGPEHPSDVVPFLERVTAGRGVPRARIDAVAEHYYARGGVSPVNGQCRLILGRLAPVARQLGLSLYWGNRNWHPFLAGTVAEMGAAGVSRALALVTSAYGGYSSCRQYLEDMAAARAEVGPGAPVIDKLRLYYNHPGWVGPWAVSVREARQRALTATGPGGGPSSGPLVVFTAHSIPEALAASSPYARQVTETARLVAEAAEVERWQVAWQSRSGSPQQPWLGPDITEVVAACDAPAVVVAPIGFVCDNMEVVHDLDVEAAAAARHQGVHFERASTVGTGPGFAAMARQLVEERLHEGTPRAALGTEAPWPDTCPEGHCPSLR